MFKEFTSNSYWLFQEKKLSFMNVVEKKLDSMLVKYDFWFFVLLAVLMVLAFSIATALAIWCLVIKGKRFTGAWKWSQYGVSVYVECA